MVLQPRPVWVSGHSPLEFEAAKIRNLCSRRHRKHGMRDISPLVAFPTPDSGLWTLTSYRSPLHANSIRRFSFALEQRGKSWPFFWPTLTNSLHETKEVALGSNPCIIDHGVLSHRTDEPRRGCSSVRASWGCTIHYIRCQTCSFRNRLIRQLIHLYRAVMRIVNDSKDTAGAVLIGTMPDGESFTGEQVISDPRFTRDEERNCSHEFLPPAPVFQLLNRIGYQSSSCRVRGCQLLAVAHLEVHRCDMNAPGSQIAGLGVLLTCWDGLLLAHRSECKGEWFTMARVGGTNLIAWDMSSRLSSSHAVCDTSASKSMPCQCGPSPSRIMTASMHGPVWWTAFLSTPPAMPIPEQDLSSTPFRWFPVHWLHGGCFSLRRPSAAWAPPAPQDRRRSRWRHPEPRVTPTYEHATEFRSKHQWCFNNESPGSTRMNPYLHMVLSNVNLSASWTCAYAPPRLGMLTWWLKPKGTAGFVGKMNLELRTIFFYESTCSRTWIAKWGSTCLRNLLRCGLPVISVCTATPHVTPEFSINDHLAIVMSEEAKLNRNIHDISWLQFFRAVQAQSIMNSQTQKQEHKK